MAPGFKKIFRIRFFPIDFLSLILLASLFFLPTRLFAQHKTLGAIATQNPLATETAAKILRQGGNAIDAAVAAALTLAVVEPYNSGLGAGGMALLWDASKKRAFALDFRERAPLAANEKMFLNNAILPNASKDGPLAIAVPGEVAGLVTLHGRWGRLPWSSLFKDAIHFAEKGFQPDTLLLKKIAARRHCLARDYDTYQIYRPFFQRQEEEPEASPIPLIQSNLAKTLKRIQEKKSEGFYRGKLGRKLVGNLQGKGALLTLFDLQQYQAVERAALVARFPFGRVWGMPLPTSGGISILRSLNTLEALQKKTKESLKENWIPWLVGVLGEIFETRNTQMGDSDFVTGMPVKKWISKSRARRDAKKILSGSSKGKTPTATSAAEGKNTTHLSIIDAQGNAVAMTLTLNLPFGSCITAGSTGILMNDQMDDFSTRPGIPNAFGLVQSQANAIAGGKRPLSSMSPTLVTEKRRPILAIGSPGGPQIITGVLQVLARRFFLGQNLRDAVKAPRIHYQGIPKKVFLERKDSAELRQQLKKLPLPIQYQSSWSNVQAAAYDPHTRTFEAFSDPRGIGFSEVVQP